MRKPAIRLLEDEEAGVPCSLGAMGPGSACRRTPIYICTYTQGNQWGSVNLVSRAACLVHGSRFADRHDLVIPMPVRVLVRRRDDIQQHRDVTARLAREVRALRRAIAALFGGDRQGLYAPDYPDANEHRQELWGDARKGAAS